VRNGSFPSLAFKASPSRGDTHFSYFGGDIRIAGERGYSNTLTLVGTDMQATSRGSFGFDQSLQYSGTGVVNALTQATSLMGSPLLASLQPILANVLQQKTGSTLSVPFTLSGTLDNPQFALTVRRSSLPAKVRVQRRSYRRRSHLSKTS